jgi:hypothetical protein
MAVYTTSHLRGLIDATQQYGLQNFLFTHLRMVDVDPNQANITFKIYKIISQTLP